MGRTIGAKNTKNFWKIKCYYPDRDLVVLEEEYPSLKEMAENLGVAYHMIRQYKNPAEYTEPHHPLIPKIEVVKIANIVV